VLVTAVEARPLRSLERVRVPLGPGITSVVGPNGVGKTNLVEALYFALTGRSFRTSDRRDLIPFGESLARAAATVRDDDGIERRLMAAVTRTEGRRHMLDGAPADPATIARARPPVAVFAPDRLSLVKGPPAERRAHLDGFLAARWPARGELRKRFGQALAQRNAMISRVAAGYGSPDRLDVWDAGVADAAAPLIAARREAVEELAPAFTEALAELGLEEGELVYAPRADGDAEELRAGLRERRDADLKLGRSGWGPHLDEVKLSFAGRALRKYGSQGQQRAALLALLFAEREALLAARRVTPLLLLDDVMSELDPGRRELLVARLATGGQTLITAADEESLPSAARDSMVRMPRPGVVDDGSGASAAADSASASDDAAGAEAA
jgi:DNA replication and repair protein RecF